MKYYFFSFLLIIIAIYIILKIIRNKEKQKIKNEFNLFIKNADIVKVQFDNFRIKTNSWTEEVVTDNGRYGVYNQMMSQGDLNIKKVDHNMHILILNVNYSNMIIRIEYVIQMEPKTLEIKLAIQKETNLYINPNNPNQYYLDMDFLN